MTTHPGDLERLTRERDRWRTAAYVLAAVAAVAVIRAVGLLPHAWPVIEALLGLFHAAFGAITA